MRKKAKSLHQTRDFLKCFELKCLKMPGPGGPNGMSDLNDYCRSTNVRARSMFANFAILTNSQTLNIRQNL